MHVHVPYVYAYAQLNLAFAVFMFYKKRFIFNLTFIVKYAFTYMSKIDYGYSFCH